MPTCEPGPRSRLPGPPLLVPVRCEFQRIRIFAKNPVNRNFVRGRYKILSSGRLISRILSGGGMSVYAPKSDFPTLYLDGHLSVQPTRNSNDASSVSSLLGLAPGGGYLAARIAADAGGLLHRLFTMTALRRLSVSVALSGKLPRPGVSPAPCSTECGLSSTLRQSAEPRPSSRPEAFYHTCSFNMRQSSDSGQLGIINEKHEYHSL